MNFVHKIRQFFNKKEKESLSEIEQIKDNIRRIQLLTNSHEEDYIARLRRMIVEQYEDHPTGCGGSFGEILCWEIHSNGLTFNWLAEKWGISVTAIGKLIYDHCKCLEKLPKVDHSRWPYVTTKDE
ncbi:hypothetical protein LCGC14_0146440 [marine sediment metagenome]|uniref:Uncharacterized protein n=1 Tax=marine sediment metagenome TaxID=412755 RepID=A0A0F9Y1G8_9ZZZZ